jgi:HD-GYP domain-containing protein (c-di-GMP phosphodiesterase class II)
MTSDRVYRKALSHSVALAEIRRGSGTQFDPRIVDAFLRCMHAQPVAIEVPNLRPV